MRRQRGLTLISLIFVGGLIVAAVLLGMKVAPSVIEYFTILKNVKALASSGELDNASVADVRRAFDKRAQIDDIRSITPHDLEVKKVNGQLVIGFYYEKRVPLFGPVSLLIDYEGSSGSR